MFAPIDALDKLELFHPEEMNDFYKLLGLNKSGLSTTALELVPHLLKTYSQKENTYFNSKTTSKEVGVF